MTNYIRKYWDRIEDGSETVGRWIQLAYEMLVKGLTDKKFFYDPDRADDIIEYFETFVHHTKGRSDLVTLELWQKAALASIYGIVDEDGLRQFKEIVLGIGRKQGKSLIAYGVGEYEFLPFTDEYGPEVYCLAPKLDQSEIVFGGIKTSIMAEPELNAMMKSRKTDLFVAENNGICKKIPFAEKRSDGFNPQCVICDEYAAWPGQAGKDQYEVMTSAIGSRRQPIILSISSANYVVDGLYDELRKRGTRVLLGESKETHLLPLFYEIDDVDKWDDLTELKKALPNLGVSVPVSFIKDEIVTARESLSKKREFLTKYCCIQQNSAAAWLSSKTVNGAMCQELKPEDFKDCYAVGGIDLSQTTDLTAACLVIERDGIEYVIAHAWLPGEKLEEATARDGIPYRELIKQGFLSISGESFIDYHDVEAWFNRMVREYQIYPLMIGYDRYSSQYLIQDMKRSGFHMDDVWQGWNMTPAIQRLEGELKDGLLKIGNNDLMKIHLLDVALKKDTESRRVMITKLTKNSHIDLCACLLDALIVKDKWHAQIGEQLKN